MEVTRCVVVVCVECGVCCVCVYVCAWGVVTSIWMEVVTASGYGSDQ